MDETTASRKEKTPHIEVGAEEAKRTLGELLSRAGFGGERIIITRHGKPLCALIGTSELERLDSAA